MSSNLTVASIPLAFLISEVSCASLDFVSDFLAVVLVEEDAELLDDSVFDFLESDFESSDCIKKKAAMAIATSAAIESAMKIFFEDDFDWKF